MAIEVSDYNPAWPKQFQELRERYERALSDIEIVGIEHVGSTSVPELAAKPIIDVDIIVTADQVQPAIHAMQRAGFESFGERGIENRWALGAPAGLPATNTYVVVDGCVALRNHLGIRDVLRSDPVLRDRYAQLKRSIAPDAIDIADYVEQKSAFLSSLLERAGLSTEERRAIEEANRAP